MSKVIRVIFFVVKYNIYLQVVDLDEYSARDREIIKSYNNAVLPNRAAQECAIYNKVLEQYDDDNYQHGVSCTYTFHYYNNTFYL